MIHLRRVALSLFVLWIGIAFFQSCEEKLKPPITIFPEGTEMPDQESWRSTIVFTDSGRVKAEVQAGHIRMFDDRKETFLDSGIVVDFFGKDGLHTSKLTAKRGKVNDLTKDLEAFDDVVFVSDSGTVVRTEYLFWDNGTKKVRSDKFVTVTSPKERLQGYGFEADQGLKNYAIYRVSGQVEMVEEK